MQTRLRLKPRILEVVKYDLLGRPSAVYRYLVLEYRAPVQQVTKNERIIYDGVLDLVKKIYENKSYRDDGYIEVEIVDFVEGKIPTDRDRKWAILMRELQL